MAVNTCFFCKRTYTAVHICPINPAANVYPPESLSDWEVPYLNKNSPIDKDRIAQKDREDDFKKPE